MPTHVLGHQRQVPTGHPVSQDQECWGVAVIWTLPCRETARPGKSWRAAGIAGGTHLGSAPSGTDP